jgi:UDP-GlcNAc:undecaprenyl-phosphate GlcNAc-1-phosphate transferase
VLNYIISSQFLLEVTAGFLSLAILANARTIGEKLHIIDLPDGERKVHEVATPLVAGLGILIPLFLWCAAILTLGSYHDTSTLLDVVLCGLGVTLVGYTDDQRSTSPSSRLLSILLFSVVALVLDRGLVPSEIGLMGLGPLPVPFWFAFPLVVIALAGFVNAVNMADGQNGLVVGMVMVWTGCIAFISSGTTSAIAETMLVTALAAFIFNVSGRAFLGDSGAYGIGFVVGLLAIQAHNIWGVPAQTVCVWFFFPVLDCLRLMVKRAWQHRYPFGADLDHFHHHLQAKLGRNRSLFAYLGVMATTSISSSLSPRLAPFCLIGLVVFYVSMMLPSKPVRAAGAGSNPDQLVRPTWSKTMGLQFQSVARRSADRDSNRCP